MTEQEKFIFKTLQWFLSLGVTVMLFLQGYMITFVYDTYSWKFNHEIHHQVNESYYIRRIYIDSTNCVNMKSDISKIKTYLNATSKDFPKLEAILPKEDEQTITEQNLLR